LPPPAELKSVPQHDVYERMLSPLGPTLRKLSPPLAGSSMSFTSQNTLPMPPLTIGLHESGYLLAR
jgi:hypothetical protein